MDGATNNDTFNTGFVLRPPPDAIEEFKILTHAFSAEYGRNAGSVVNVVTKSGSNTLSRRALGIQSQRCVERAQLFRAGRRSQAGAETEPVRRRVRRPVDAQSPVRVRLLRGLPQRQRHHAEHPRAVGGATRRRLLRRRGDSRSAHRPAVRRQHDPADRISPVGHPAAQRLRAAAERGRQSLYRVADGVRLTRSIRHPVRLPARRSSVDARPLHAQHYRSPDAAHHRADRSARARHPAGRPGLAQLRDQLDASSTRRGFRSIASAPIRRSPAA